MPPSELKHVIARLETLNFKCQVEGRQFKCDNQNPTNQTITCYYKFFHADARETSVVTLVMRMKQPFHVDLEGLRGMNFKDDRLAFSSLKLVHEDYASQNTFGPFESVAQVDALLDHLKDANLR